MDEILRDAELARTHPEEVGGGMAVAAAGLEVESHEAHSITSGGEGRARESIVAFEIGCVPDRNSSLAGGDRCRAKPSQRGDPSA